MLTDLKRVQVRRVVMRFGRVGMTDGWLGWMSVANVGLPRHWRARPCRLRPSRGHSIAQQSPKKRTFESSNRIKKRHVTLH